MIFSLPITVRDSAPLGYWLTPVLVDALSKQLRERGILFYGKFGLQSPSLAVEKEYQRQLDFLNLTCERKSDTEFEEELLGLSRQICSGSSVLSREQECYRCPCGCLELPVSIALFAKEKTFKRVGDIYVCKACRQKGERIHVESKVLGVGSDWSLESVSIYPKWYRGELKELVYQLCQQGIPMSRSRETGLYLNGINLDVEFVWLLIPLLLSLRNPGERIRLVVTNHVLRQATIALLLASSFNPDLRADLIISPYISHPGVLEKWELDRLIELGFTGELLRFILIGSLGWQVKDSSLYDLPASVEYRRFILLQKRIHNALNDPSTILSTPFTPEEVMRNLSQRNLASGLKHVFNPEHFEYRTLIGVL
ncbi:MAG: hypothetical protein Q8Q22_02125 [bacterium]|nr:hypothetical protein [bacterium]